VKKLRSKRRGCKRGGSNRRGSNRRGSILIMLAFLMVMFMAICTLAVDYGHIQLVKSEMQRTADAVARGYMEYYITQSESYANSNGTSLYSNANNPMDSLSGVSPTVSITWGFWTTSNTFSTSSSTGAIPAVQVTVTRTAANNNAVPLFWGGALGVLSCDVHATAVAAEGGGQTTPVTIPSTASLYLAGMPSGSTATGGDDTSNAAAYQVPSIPVTPGTWISFTNITGTTCVSPGGTPNSGPAGLSSYPCYCGQSWNNSPDSPTTQNGIADAYIDDSATTGLFLGANAPNTTTAPSTTVDWTQTSQNNQATYSNLTTQQPFMIGTGSTTGSTVTVKQFLVPPGATRLFLGIWDGYEYNNNTGSLSGTVTVQHYVEMVQ
jgi:Flp pilus assembly protein TadG